MACNIHLADQAMVTAERSAGFSNQPNHGPKLCQPAQDSDTMKLRQTGGCSSLACTAPIQQLTTLMAKTIRLPAAFFTSVTGLMLMLMWQHKAQCTCRCCFVAPCGWCWVAASDSSFTAC